MAHPKSSAKSLRVSIRRRARNKPIRSAVKTFARKAEALIASKAVDEAQAAVLQAVSTFDRAASKGVIHPNNAARHKSRLMKKLNKAISA